VHGKHANRHARMHVRARTHKHIHTHTCITCILTCICMHTMNDVSYACQALPTFQHCKRRSPPLVTVFLQCLVSHSQQGSFYHCVLGGLEAFSTTPDTPSLFRSSLKTSSIDTPCKVMPVFFHSINTQEGVAWKAQWQHQQQNRCPQDFL